MLRRFLKHLHHVVFHASREGRAAEIVMWSNAIASLGLGGGIYVLFHSWAGAVVAAILAFVLLRAAITNRHTVWIAASCGTLAVSALFGGLAWLFGHTFEAASAPTIASVVVSVGTAVGPAWAYGRIAQRRETGRDSLIDPVSLNAREPSPSSN